MGQLMDAGYMVEMALKAGGETLRTDLQLLDSKSSPEGLARPGKLDIGSRAELPALIFKEITV